MTVVALSRLRACRTAWQAKVNRHHVALWVAIAANFALAACGGGGTDERPTTAPTGPVVGAPQTTDGRHCPDRTIPVPPGLDFGGYTVANMDFKGVNLRGANFDDATLKNLNLAGDLTGTTFRGAHITGVVFSPDSKLDNANFEGAVFDNDNNAAGATALLSKLVDTCFIGATFHPPHTGNPPHFLNSLIRVDFSYSDILSAPVTPGTNIDNVLADPSSQGNMFRGINIPCKYLKTAYEVSMDLSDFLGSKDFDNCANAYINKDMSNFAFDGLDLRDFVFLGTNIAGATFKGATLGSRDPDAPSEPLGNDDRQHYNQANYSGAIFVNAFIGHSYIDYQGVDFSKAQFRNVNVRGNFQNARFDNATMTNVAFHDAEFLGTRFTGATLNAVTFAASDFDSATDFTSARVTGAGDPTTPDFAVTLDGVKFDQAVLSAINFGGTSMVGASFQHAMIASSTMFMDSAGHMANAANAHFESAIADGADFRGLQATGAHFDSASLGGSRWDRAVLDAASFQGATLNGAVFTGAQARGALFNGATAIGADFSKTVGLQGANFTNAELSNSTFVGALLDTLTTATPPIVNPAQFTGAHLKNVNFNGARLDGVDFSSASLYGTTQAGSAPTMACVTDVAMCTATRTGMTCGCASASGASMVGTNFTKAFLYGVDFSNGTFGKTFFNQAILVAANFGGAQFISDTGKGGGVSQFRQALLQGVALGDANLTNASLDGAQVDFGVDGTAFGGNDLMVKLDASYTAFAGWAQPNQPVCVLTVYGRGQPSRLPTASADMTCPDGLVHEGGCGRNSSTNAQWKSPVAIDVGPPQAAYIATPSFGAKGNLESFGCPLSNRSTTW